MPDESWRGRVGSDCAASQPKLKLEIASMFKTPLGNLQRMRTDSNSPVHRKQTFLLGLLRLSVVDISLTATRGTLGPGFSAPAPRHAYFSRGFFVEPCFGSGGTPRREMGARGRRFQFFFFT